MNLPAAAGGSDPTKLSKTEQAHRLISSKISSGELAPGHRLVLSAIAEELGVSVVPVREAIRQLEAEGLVTFERNVGAKVRMIDRNQYLDCMQTLAVLEGTATALAAPYLTSGELAKARELNEKMEATLREFDPVEFTVLNRKFHRTLVGRCPNRHLIDLVTQEWARLNHLRESIFAFVPDRAAESVAEHSRIITMIEVGADPEYIEKLVRQHRLTTLDHYLNADKKKDTTDR
ncbi:GntR family transcriptional regulator [Corynebacterium pygosceleis]|uniref:GntR family transcriptional regulator n=1 Tax=Corynebacterium pygosceleis TaxID=2800406 RepID=A0A9Q4C980_9CORY|nr:GntR family transcriptional regulator [Corynebacterium pygosceleis]MCK7636475.1 GntR family transcriptional regulator [Corynebacterium pygosceleis]MCK7675049.1 GntR family transcriptional regulator [Corynebacterium pygosceleis]MCL0121460.1 GntR family transcriptional regulator [Corynebacterium pygosceleis]MCX7445543.1 GntR family transcriptional regulator [Corynebacterium pygosceleis]MCX7469211.1 GntR family transcriptional regulator [Corynebacterium pygosceleis]